MHMKMPQVGNIPNFKTITKRKRPIVRTNLSNSCRDFLAIHQYAEEKGSGSNIKALSDNAMNEILDLRNAMIGVGQPDGL